MLFFKAFDQLNQQFEQHTFFGRQSGSAFGKEAVNDFERALVLGLRLNRTRQGFNQQTGVLGFIDSCYAAEV